MLRSLDVRKAAKAAAKMLPVHQQEAINHYLAYSTGVVQQHRRPHPQCVVDTAVLLDSLAG